MGSEFHMEPYFVRRQSYPNHSSLAPLTSRLPIFDKDAETSNNPSTSSTSDPVSARPQPTRRATSHPAREQLSDNAGGSDLSRSKSASHLSQPHRRRHHHHHHHHAARHGTTAGGLSDPARVRPTQTFLRALTDTDFLQHMGACIATEARESKGQGWLLKRASATSLAAGLPSPLDDDYYEDGPLPRHLSYGGLTLQREQEMAAEAAGMGSRVGSRWGSRRTSWDHNNHNDGSGNGRNGDNDGRRSGYTTPRHSRFGSRVHSRAESIDRLAAAVGDNGVVVEEGGGYFDLEMALKRRKELGTMPGPDFVNVDDRLESAELQHRAISGKSRSQDEAYLKELLREGGGGGSWLNMLGFGFFNVKEDDEDEQDEEESEWQRIQRELDEETAEERELRRAASLKRLHEIMISPMEERPPPPSEKGGWLDDAAWLLGVASRVLL
ncbi:hypothetical protein VTI74DRAFT_2386 [Chaetomium olivicolor]